MLFVACCCYHHSGCSYDSIRRNIRINAISRGDSSLTTGMFCLIFLRSAPWNLNSQPSALQRAGGDLRKQARRALSKFRSVVWFKVQASQNNAFAVALEAQYPYSITPNP